MNIKSNKKTWLGAMFSFALVAIMGLTFAFKASNHVESKKATYFFRYDGPLGSEANESLWTSVSSTEPSCSGDNDGCLIEVNEDYTSQIGSNPRILNTPVPVTTVGLTHKNPQTGTGMIVNAYNKNP